MFDPSDRKTSGYHVFLLPQGKLFDGLKYTIDTLAERYDGVRFDPHVTLLARIPVADENELVAKTKKLAGMMKSFIVEPKTVEAQDEYYRALYAKAEFSDELKIYHEAGLGIFGYRDTNVYFPHLSLYYGDAPRSIKDAMISSLSLPAQMSFAVDKIYLYRTPGEPKNWVRIGEYSIGQSW